jgi:dipeptidase E
VCPHLDREDGHPETPWAEIAAWADGLSVPAYVIDDRTAIKVVDGTVDVVSEGRWELLNTDKNGAKAAEPRGS